MPPEEARLSCPLRRIKTSFAVLLLCVLWLLDTLCTCESFLNQGLLYRHSTLWSKNDYPNRVSVLGAGTYSILVSLSGPLPFQHSSKPIPSAVSLQEGARGLLEYSFRLSRTFVVPKMPEYSHRLHQLFPLKALDICISGSRLYGTGNAILYVIISENGSFVTPFLTLWGQLRSGCNR